jgi:hypothetical protein
MGNQEIKPEVVKSYEEELEQMREFAKKLSSSKKKSLQFLQDAGIATPTGRLTKFYRSK